MRNEPRYWNEATLAPTEAKRQHYVPRMYLEAFTGVDRKTRVVDLDEGKEFRTSVRNAAVETYFNDVEIGDEHLSTEEWLSELEGLASPVLTELINDPTSICSLSLDEELRLARFITALKFRTPAFREWNDDLMSRMASQIKEIIKDSLYHQLEKEEADAYWNIWGEKPDYWWIHQSDSYQPSATSASMLSEVQGFANLLIAAAWKIGNVPDSIQLYTSDNPVSSYLRPVRPWWEGGAFASYDYFIPLSPRVLLKIERRPYCNGNENLKRRGRRRYRDFSRGETSFARHVVTVNATRYLFGEGLVVARECATSCIERIGRANLAFAMRYLGFDPRPPAGQGFPV